MKEVFANGTKNELPTILVIFGATGDLMMKKLAPALFRLYEKKLLPGFFQVVGFSRRDIPREEFRAMVRAAVRAAHNGAKNDDIETFTRLFIYAQGTFNAKKGYANLAKLLGAKDSEWRTCANKLFYLAVPPQHYKNILTNLATSGLTEPCSPEEGWTRVVVEKPFGKDQKTAETLDRLLGKLFKEEQIYRIDHYLGKETVQNILAFRFSNSFLEPAWDKDSIERIHIQFLQKGGAEGRGEFYDSLGALRDVGQNHMLQLLALFTMENPGNFATQAIRSGRAAILRSLHILTPKDAERFTIHGQYEDYRNEKGVKPNSQTETYFRIQAAIDEPRWRGVPIILEGGKSLGEDRVEATVIFRHPSPCLCPQAPEKHYKNLLRYHIQPKEGVTASFWVKKPGTKLTLEEKDFAFDYQSAYVGEAFIDAYERLLLDVIVGNQTLFVSTDEIFASWKFIDPIIRTWQRKKPPLRFYKPGSTSIFKEPLQVEIEIKKELGYIGLGKMGRNMVLRMMEKGWRATAYDADSAAREEALTMNIPVADNFTDVIRSLTAPRLIWLMVPAGKPVDEVLFGTKDGEGIVSLLERGDVIIDGGNSFYEDSARRAKKLTRLGLRFFDIGVSGGPGGARYGASLMIGGERALYEKFESLFRDLALPGGYGYMGRSGAGHFVKMVHNGIEYGMMQALAEGFTILKMSPLKFDLERIAELYNNGSVIESRLVGWLRDAYFLYGRELDSVSGSVGYTGEGEWTVKTAKKMKVPAPIIEEAFKFRVQSYKEPSYTGKVLSALRHQFGGHSIAKEKPK